MRRSIVFLVAVAIAAAAHDHLSGIALFHQLAAERTGNLLFSPYSLATGLEGQAALPATPDYQLTTANALWVSPHIPELPKFYGHVERLDLTRSDATQTINRWVSTATHGRIASIIDAGMLTPKTRAVLTNAVWFKAAWYSPFDAAETRPEPFRLSSGAIVKVPMMHQREVFDFALIDHLRILSMPYGTHGAMSMVVLLPTGDLRELESSLTQKKIDSWIAGLHETEVILTFPRFRSESDLVLPDLNLKGIDKVVQRTRIDVTEEGTEAAASTGIAVTGTMALGPPQIFRADHPFLYLIRHNETGTILFVGRLADPR